VAKRKGGTTGSWAGFDGDVADKQCVASSGPAAGADRPVRWCGRERRRGPAWV